MLASILINLLGARFGVVVSKFLPYVAGLLLLVGAYFYVRYDAYNDGVSDTKEAYEIVIRQERERLQAANDKAISEANERIASLNKLLRERDEAIKQILKEALEDPNAARPAIGADSVRRLNRPN